jgi:integrase
MKLTDKIAQTATNSGCTQLILWDDKIKGFGLRITSNNVKSFILNYRINGRERRLTIGQYPTWSAAAARDECAKLKRLVDVGEDPLATRDELHKTPTFAQLIELYFNADFLKLKDKTKLDYSNYINRELLPALGTFKVQDIKHEQCVRLHVKISARGAPYYANRVLALLSKIFSFAIKCGYRVDNPSKGLQKNNEIHRERYLTIEEVQRLINILDAHANKQSATVIKLLLYTGARKTEVLSAKWEQFDLINAVWIKPASTTKQKREHRIPLSTIALNTILAIPQRSDYLFPLKESYQKDIKGFWRSICAQANIKSVRIHDLRHTYASLLVNAGLSLPVIGALLGHSQPQTTARYAHLNDNALRDATNAVAKKIT